LSTNVGTGDATPFTHIHDGIKYAGNRIARDLAVCRRPVFGDLVPSTAQESYFARRIRERAALCERLRWPAETDYRQQKKNMMSHTIGIPS
jgi:hypothetical protein